MAKETTLNELGSRMDGLGSRMDELGTMMEHVIKHMATKEDVVEIVKEVVKGEIAMVRNDMATKEQMFVLQTQVNSIEGQLRTHGRLEVRVGNLEEKVFGEARA